MWDFCMLACVRGITPLPSSRYHRLSYTRPLYTAYSIPSSLRFASFSLSTRHLLPILLHHTTITALTTQPTLSVS